MTTSTLNRFLAKVQNDGQKKDLETNNIISLTNNEDKQNIQENIGYDFNNHILSDDSVDVD